MPFINVKTNVSVSDEKKRAIQDRLSDVISLLPGKSDRYLMVAVEDNISMMFHRDTDEPIAMVEVKVFGSVPRNACMRLTTAVCVILREEVGVDGAGCYVKFEECSLWGTDSYLF